ncbi:MAG: hypothetical protein ACPHID_06735 [Thermoplasmatota archaeon]
MLEFHPLQERRASVAEIQRLLHAFQEILARDGMADMDEYGDMLKWALPSRDGWCRYFHAYHESFCSWDDRFYGTIHDHGGRIRGTILIGALDHGIYEATVNPDGTHAHQGTRYNLVRHNQRQPAGTTYELAPRVAHWPKPNGWTVTYFEEEDNGEMGDLVILDDAQTDAFNWEQEDADARLSELQDLVTQHLEHITAG